MLLPPPDTCTCSLRTLSFQAFEEGGGGARAVAQRILAEAKAVASQKPKTEGPDPRYALFCHLLCSPLPSLWTLLAAVHFRLWPSVLPVVVMSVMRAWIL